MIKLHHLSGSVVMGNPGGGGGGGGERTLHGILRAMFLHTSRLKSPEEVWPQPKEVWSQPKEVWSQPKEVWSQTEEVWSQPK